MTTLFRRSRVASAPERRELALLQRRRTRGWTCGGGSMAGQVWRNGRLPVEFSPAVPSLYVSAVNGDGMVVGTGRVTTLNGWAGIYCMSVHPDFRRQGIAAAILARSLPRPASRCSTRRGCGDGREFRRAGTLRQRWIPAKLAATTTGRRRYAEHPWPAERQRPT